MSAAVREISDDAAQLSRLAGDVAALEAVVAGWAPAHQAVVGPLKAAIEALHREALLRLVRGLRADAAAGARLGQVVHDPVVFGVLRLHGLVRDPLEARVRAALACVTPLLARHGGGVELLTVTPPDTVHVRLTGACQGCPASGQTLREGVQRALQEQVPEITRVIPVGGGVREGSAAHGISPFAREPGDGFIPVGLLAELESGAVCARTVSGREVLLYRDAEQVTCLDNQCAHLGMAQAGGEVDEGVIRCPHHGFRYWLDTGECLTVPQVQLVVHAVRVREGQVEVKLDG